MEESSSCFSCGYVTAADAADKKCPKCGRRLRPAKQVRRLGWLQLAIGVFLIGLMGTITYNVAPLLLQAGESAGGARFTGTPAQAHLILALFGMVLVFGFGSIVSGIWQIKTGRRNKWLFILMVALFLVLIGFSWYLRAALRNG